MNHPLAIDGGPRAVTEALPGFLDRAGRTFGEEEETLVLEALRSGCLSRNGGTMVKRLESEFAALLGVPYAIACSSGTASVHLTIAALDLEPGDEVIVPPITDIGSVVPVLWQNAMPVFADVDLRTMVLDPADVEARISSRTRAIMAVHLAGQPCDMTALREIADRHRLMLIEDCSQAWWAEHQGRRVGTIGDIACFSLQQTKHITCGEGGLVVTRNPEFARRALLFSDKAWPRDSSSLGSCRFLFLAQNYRMSELQGAVALAQLGKLEDVLTRRRDRARQLSASLANVAEVSAPFVPPDTRHSWWLYMLRVNEKNAAVGTREFGAALTAEGVPAWVQYIIDPLYFSPMFTEPRTYGTSGYPISEFGRQRYARGLCPNAEQALSNVIAIHWNENYTPDHVESIAAAIKKVAAHYSIAAAHR
ncbi:MAG TPA: DegT/DnrJ/EryC1/StrS family aminotransferase [Bryobacteraceae bacterium]|jgi:dTDP-4-amino-4,6-dideoxygalactose transaminase